MVYFDEKTITFVQQIREISEICPDFDQFCSLAK